MSSWHAYPKVWALGHKILAELLLDEVIVEEKLDGSQFSFGVIDGEPRCRSKGCVLNIFAPEKMFIEAVKVVTELKDNLTPGWTYRAEYLAKPKHNVLAYSRIPANHLMIFDVNTEQEDYLSYPDKKIEAERLGLECMPLVYQGVVEDRMVIREWLEKESCLGGQKIEGVVLKNYKRFGPDGKALMGKFVSEAFKEIAGGDWRERNPGSGDIIQQLIDRYKTPARWAKAIQHLKERGELKNDPCDIGPLFKEVSTDVHTECGDEIAKLLFAWGWPKIQRAICSGLPQWYKEELLKQQFDKGTQ